jgi:hypothetical protein
MQLVAGEWYSSVQHLTGHVCGILSNPPYIDKELLPTLQESPPRMRCPYCITVSRANSADMHCSKASHKRSLDNCKPLA